MGIITSDIGGKARGLYFLLAHARRLGYKVPKFLAVQNGFWDILSYTTIEVAKERRYREKLITDIEPGKIAQIQKVRYIVNFNPRLAIRSSSTLEDTINSPAAGIFKTKYYAFGKSNDFGAFRAVLLEVLNSTYGRKANAYFRLMGYKNIPPLATVIQELVGKKWEFAPGWFFPLVSGVINTADPDKIKIATVYGFGHTAVKGYRTTSHVIDKKAIEHVSIPQTEFPFSTALDQNNELHYDCAFLPNDLALAPTLHQRLASIALELETAMGQALDIEWASPDGKEIYLLQCRPIKQNQVMPLIKLPHMLKNQHILYTDDFG